MHRTSTRRIVGLLVVLVATSLPACDTIEQRATVEGRYEAVQFETLVSTGDSLFLMDLLDAGALFEFTLERQDGRRTMNGRVHIPDGTFADTLTVWAVPGVPGGDVDSLDRRFEGAFVVVKRELSLGADADTAAAFPLPADYAVMDQGRRLRALTSGAVITPADTFSVITLVLEKK